MTGRELVGFLSAGLLGLVVLGGFVVIVRKAADRDPTALMLITILLVLGLLAAAQWGLS